ncbi:hypothetical protein AMJ83_00605 [candidate division WOR_3 bacterium SM23_42]|uniref:Putative zinc-finger domain-containing protein n=1 Tax=candidate division WOR_3 bacterium SM23_42 TaxID=1703779 RepID=A0A0S8FVN6_UNCW3|nr:MAG: hypothetical protein AMJ83_00605 [candidate division WOR_3 bacterium SM23_42]
MKCNEIENLQLDYVLEELTPELKIQVNEHLAICEKCSNEVKQTEALIKGFKDSERFNPASNVYGRISRQISVPEPKRVRFLGMPRSVVFAFAAFVLGIVITRSTDTIIMNIRAPSRTEVRQETPRKTPFSDTVEFYSVPAKNLARL